MKKENSVSTVSADHKSSKNNKLLKIIIPVLAVLLIIFMGFIISDLLFSSEDETPSSEFITVTVTGTNILLNGTEKVTEDGLYDYFRKSFENDNRCTVALINDSKSPADVETYNNVVEILKKFGIEHQPITDTATNDETTD